MLILSLFLSVFRIQIYDRLYLILAQILWQDKLIDEPVLSNHDTLLINDIIEFTIILLQNIVFIILVLFIVLQILIASAAIIALHIIFSVVLIITAVFTLEDIRFALSFFLSMLIVQLFKNILNLSLKLIIHLIH